jgi:hypothetical protein
MRQEERDRRRNNEVCEGMFDRACLLTGSNLAGPGRVGIPIRRVEKRRLLGGRFIALCIVAIRLVSITSS